MRIAYFNCSSGIAGDMILASFLNAGLDAKRLENTLKKALRFKNWKLEVKSTESLYHIPLPQVNVKGEKKFASPIDMVNFIKRSGLSAKVKGLSLKILESMILAESKVHKMHKSRIHFHELNSLDTVIDITGSCLALELLKIDEVYASNINIGRPAPAALELVRKNKVPVYSNNPDVELATPTGLAVISNMVIGFGEMPQMVLENYGMGAGTQKINRNYLTVSIGQSLNKENTYYSSDEVVVLETNIDDMDPRIYPYLIEKALSLGAKDAWLTQVLMKKGRPGIVLSVICHKNNEKDIVNLLFNETTTLGIRRRESNRYILNRKLLKDKKIAYLSGKKMKVKSEYENAKLQSLRTHKPLKNIIY
jgi:hypothetical protein